MKRKNIIAKDLMSKKYKPRIVKPKKGKGSFKRKWLLKVLHNNTVEKQVCYLNKLVRRKRKRNIRRKSNGSY